MQNLGGQTKSIMLFSELAYWFAVMVCVINGFRPEKCKRIDLFSHAHNIPISAVTFSWGGGGWKRTFFARKSTFFDFQSSAYLALPNYSVYAFYLPYDRQHGCEVIL